MVVGLGGLTALVVLNGLAYQYFWYWKHYWADIPMHLLGGLTIIALVLFGAKKPTRLWPALGLLLLVSVAWELFEFKFSHFLPYQVMFKALPMWERGLADTFSDILFDVLGGLLAYGILNNDQEIKT